MGPARSTQPLAARLGTTHHLRPARTGLAAAAVAAVLVMAGCDSDEVNAAEAASGSDEQQDGGLAERFETAVTDLTEEVATVARYYQALGLCAPFRS